MIWSCQCYHSWSAIWQWSRTPTRNHWVMLDNDTVVTCCYVLQDHSARYCRRSGFCESLINYSDHNGLSADSRSSLIAVCTIWQNWSVDQILQICRFAADLLIWRLHNIEQFLEWVTDLLHHWSWRCWKERRHVLKAWIPNHQGLAGHVRLILCCILIMLWH